MANVTIINSPTQVSNVSGGGQQTQSSTEAGGQHPNLPQGSLVSGTISGRDGTGNFILKSAQGTFTLQSSTPLTYNSDVTIRIGANAAGNTSARIVSVNGEPFAEFSAPEAEASDTVSTSQTAPVAQTGTDTAQAAATSVRGVIVSAPAPAANPQADTNLVAGNTVILRIPQPQTGTDVEQSQAQVTDTSAPSTSITNAANQAVQPEQVAQSAQPALLQQTAVVTPQPQQVGVPVGTPIAVATAAPVETELSTAQTVTQAAQVEPSADGAQQGAAQTTGQSAAPQPQQPATTQQSNAAASTLYSAYTKQSPAASVPAAVSASISSNTQTIPAQVAGTDENGNLSLQTLLGNVTIKTAAAPELAAFTPGTAVTLEVITNAPLQTLVAAEPAALNELAASWQSLKDMVNLEETYNNASTNSALLSHLPQLGAAFVSESTAFITALLQGDTRKLLGDDTVDSLKENGRSDLLDKFTAEASTLSDAFNTPTTRQTPSWQTLFLPFVFQQALQQARIYVKRDNTKKDRAGKPLADTRFVVEVDLSEIGPLQLDGLVRKQQKSLAFDLIVRSHNAFSQQDKSEILAIYNSAAELTNFRGTISFQVTRDFPVKPLEEIAKEESRSITV